MADVVMPQLGETVTEGTITRWFKQIGDEIAADEALFEVSTDKVDSEVPSPAAGVLTEIVVGEGETVDVGTKLAVIGDADSAPAADSDSSPEAEAEPADTDSSAEAEAESADTDTDSSAEAEAESADTDTPEEDAGTPETDADAESDPESEPEPEPEVAPEAEPEPAPVAASSDNGSAAADADPASDAAHLLSPVVRRLVNENDLDIDEISGTGVGGRITRSDVEKAIQDGSAKAAPATTEPGTGDESEPAARDSPETSTKDAPAPAAKDAPAEAPEATPEAAPAARAARAEPPRAGEDDEVIPFNTIRRVTGDYMVRSKATSPHVLTAVEVDFEGVEKVRRAHRDEWKAEEGFSLTYLPFIIRAVCDALHEFPHMNASVGEDGLIVHKAVNMAIAVDLDFEGLLAPVIDGADGKRLRQLSRDIVDVATRARAKKVTPDELTGGTFTITNPGQYGTMMQFPIINQPQVAILSTDGISRRPVVVTDDDGNEAIAIHSVGVLALAWDHRAFDGAYAAAFLDELRTIIESRDWEAEIS